jgi:hypothetical protein
MPYIYNDEDNNPMSDDAMHEDPWMKYTVYPSKAEAEADMRGEVPFTEPDKGCWNCLHYNGDFCTLLWNNLDEAYKVDWRDAKDPDDWCPSWEKDEEAVWEDYHGTDT